MIISFAEHNGNYSVAFKNVQDWASRLKKKMWGGIPMFLLSTSPGGRGGANVMGVALQFMPRMGAEVAAHFSLPSFKDNFSAEGIADQELRLEFEKQLSLFEEELS
jgi:NAD(P)H-dependent FMN reductase